MLLETWINSPKTTRLSVRDPLMGFVANSTPANNNCVIINTLASVCLQMWSWGQTLFSTRRKKGKLRGRKKKKSATENQLVENYLPPSPGPVVHSCSPAWLLFVVISDSPTRSTEDGWPRSSAGWRQLLDGYGEKQVHSSCPCQQENHTSRSQVNSFIFKPFSVTFLLTILFSFPK